MLTSEPQGNSPTVTFEEFLQRHDDTHAEWVNGRVVPMSPASDRHADLTLWLGALLRHLVESGRGGWVRAAPFLMRCGPDQPGREPDVLYLAPENLSRLRDTWLDGPADVAVEIVSPESAVRDRGEKFYEYERGGVREYWLIDPVRGQAEFYQQGAGGLYTAAVIGDDHVFRSRVIDGFWLDTRWLWQPQLPALMTVLKAWLLA